MDLSVVVPTYNRCDTLQRALSKLVAQQSGHARYEIIIVDNNSTDCTREVAHSFVEQCDRVHYLFERRQGLSSARNAGIKAARADLIAFTDDDVEVAHDWVERILEAAARYPNASFLGGRVLPVLNRPLPAWARLRMAPFALQELGNEPLCVSQAFPRTLIGACLIVRRCALIGAGLFSTKTQRVKDGVGSTEDADWEEAVWKQGGHGMYVPSICCYTDIPESRLTKSYHRKWHVGHGKFNAKARRPGWEGGTWRFLDVPAFMYRQTLEIGINFVRLRFGRQPADAFEQECLLFFYYGFFKERWSEQLFRRRKELERRLAS